MQNDAGLKSLLTEPGLYPMPLAEAGIAAVDVRDIGEATAVSLTHEGHAGKSYNLASKELLSDSAATAIPRAVAGLSSAPAVKGLRAAVNPMGSRPRALLPGPRFRSRIASSGRGHSRRRRSRCSDLSAMC